MTNNTAISLLIIISVYRMKIFQIPTSVNFYRDIQRKCKWQKNIIAKYFDRNWVGSKK